MKNIKEHKKRIEELQTKIEVVHSVAKEEFFSDLSEVMKKHGVDAIRMPVNNHEFNDGDATDFYVCYDGLSFSYKGQEEDDEMIDPNESDMTAEQEKIWQSLSDIFEEYNSLDGFFESFLSDSYESVDFSINKNGVVKIV